VQPSFEAKSARTYRFIEGEWKERGVGPLKLLKHKESGKIRMLMRRDKTLKVCVNFFVKPSTDVQEHAGSDKAMVFTTMVGSCTAVDPVQLTHSA
jgi:Ran-binding protein 1